MVHAMVGGLLAANKRRCFQDGSLAAGSNESLMEDLHNR